MTKKEDKNRSSAQGSYLKGGPLCKMVASERESLDISKLSLFQSKQDKTKQKPFLTLFLGFYIYS